MLKSQYFDVIDEQVSVIVDDENDPVALDEEKTTTGPMANYMSAISRSVTK